MTLRRTPRTSRRLASLALSAVVVAALAAGSPTTAAARTSPRP